MFIFLSGNSSGQNIDLQFLLKIKIGEFEDLIQLKKIGETYSKLQKSWRNKFKFHKILEKQIILSTWRHCLGDSQALRQMYAKIFNKIRA